MGLSTIVLDGSTYQLLRSQNNPPDIGGKAGPLDASQQNRIQQVPIIWDNFVGGMGSAFRYVPETYAWTYNGYCRSPRSYMPGGYLTEISLPSDVLGSLNTGGEVSTSFEWQGHLWVGMGRYLVRFDNKETLTSTGGGIVYDRGSGRQIVDSVVYQQFPYMTQKVIAEPNTTVYKKLLTYYSTTNSWVESPGPNPLLGATPVYAEFLAKVFWEVDNVGGYRLITNDTASTFIQVEHIDQNVILDSTAWSGSLRAGESSEPVTALVATGQHVYFVKRDGVYDITGHGSYCPNLTPYYSEFINKYNGRVARLHDGYLMIGTVNGMDRVDVASQVRIDEPGYAHPGYYLANATPVTGLPLASTTDFGWFVVGLWNGTDSHIVYGKNRQHYPDIKGPGPMIWHGSECTLRNQRVTHLRTVSLESGARRMYIFTHDGTKIRAYWLSLPETGNPEQDYLLNKSHRFAEESSLYLPMEDWKQGGAVKGLRKFNILSGRLTDPDTKEQRGLLDIYASIDKTAKVYFDDATTATTAWKLQGTATNSPRASFIPTDDVMSGYDVGLLLKGRLVSATDTTKHPFIINSITAYAEVIVDQLTAKQYEVIFAEGNSRSTGTRSTQDVVKAFEKLANLHKAGPIIMIDEFNNKLKVQVEPGIQHRIQPEREGQQWSIRASFVVTILGRPFWWDTGALFDDEFFWS